MGKYEIVNKTLYELSLIFRVVITTSKKGKERNVVNNLDQRSRVFYNTVFKFHVIYFRKKGTYVQIKLLKLYLNLFLFLISSGREYLIIIK